MFAILLQAIFAASQPDSTEMLTESHLQTLKKRAHPQKLAASIPKKKPRKWKGTFEHKDTPIHHHSCH